MATFCASSSLESAEEKTNGFKLMRLILDGGTEALRSIFLSKQLRNLQAVLLSHYFILFPLKNRKTITQPQWEKMFPGPSHKPDIKEYDISLLCMLLTNICGISTPSTGWNNKPVDSDNSLGANIIRLKRFRNKYCGHVAKTSVSDDDFKKRWEKVSAVLIHLGVSPTEIERLKNEECGEDEVNRVRKEWSESDSAIAQQLLGIKRRLTEMGQDIKLLKLGKISCSDNELNNYLQWCDFRREIELFSQKCSKGSREWIFEQVFLWFNDAKSENRAFIISARAGMGKSVIAAVICERFRDQLAACHFCQYNDSKYNNPKFLLQSIAWQMSNVFPEYNEALLKKLSGKGGESVDDLNVLGLFSHLLKEPFSNNSRSGKPFLIVIDAVDESDFHGRNELVDLIADHFHKLPSFIRFLITTRPEQDIVKTFENLNPLELSPNDERNMKDIQLFLHQQLAEFYPSEYLQNLVEKSEGLFLFAHFLCKFVKDSSSQLDIESVPCGIRKMYEVYLKRLRKDLELLGINEDKLLLFLGVMVAAKEPLPLVFVERCFCQQSSVSFFSKGRIRKVITCISSFLVLEEERVKFFHKSVNDWLLGSEHDFAIDADGANETLAKFCAKHIDDLMKREVKFHKVD